MSWYLMHRGWLDNPAFKPEPLTEREAWLWLIENAAYEDTVACVRGQPAKICRGSLSFSLRFLAQAWGWDDPVRVRRYLRRLENWGMIALSTVTKQSVITLCNYERYQSPSAADDTKVQRKRNTKRNENAALEATNNNEVNEGKEPKQENNTLPEWVPQREFDAFLEFRQSQKRPIKTAHARHLLITELDELRREGHDIAQVLNQSISNCWLGVFAPKVKLPKPTWATAPEKKSYGLKMMEATARAVSDALNMKEGVK